MDGTNSFYKDGRPGFLGYIEHIYSNFFAEARGSNTKVVGQTRFGPAGDQDDLRVRRLKSLNIIFNSLGVAKISKAERYLRRIVCIIKALKRSVVDEVVKLLAFQVLQ